MVTRKINLTPETIPDFDPDTQTRVGLTELIELENARLGDVVAAVTESRLEAEIDARNGLRGRFGRRPVPADFDGLLTPEGNSGDVVGVDILDDPFALGETGSTGGVDL